MTPTKKNANNRDENSRRRGAKRNLSLPEESRYLIPSAARGGGGGNGGEDVDDVGREQRGVSEEDRS